MNFSIIESDVSTVGNACRSNNIEELRLLLDNNAVIDASDNRGWLPLHEAANIGSVQCVEALLAAAVERNIESQVNAQSYDGYTPLMLAASAGKVSVVTKLVHDHKADKKVTSADCSTAAILAVRSLDIHQGNSDLVAWKILRLVAYEGMSSAAPDYTGYNLLHHTIEKNMLRCFKVLVKAGFSLGAAEQCHGRSPLFLCAEHNRCNMMRMIMRELKIPALSQHDIEHRRTAAEELLQIPRVRFSKLDLLNAPAHDGLPPLGIALNKHHIECVDILLRYGANPGTYYVDKEGRPEFIFPLDMAIAASNIEGIKILLSHMDLEKWHEIIQKKHHDIPFHNPLSEPSYIHPVVRIVREGVQNAAEIIEVFASQSNFLHTRDVYEKNTCLVNVLEDKTESSSIATKCAVIQELLKHKVDCIRKSRRCSPFVLCPFSNRIWKAFVNVDLHSGSRAYTGALHAHSLCLQSLPLVVFFALIVQGVDLQYTNSNKLDSDLRDCDCLSCQNTLLCKLVKKDMLDYMLPKGRGSAEVKSLIHLSRLKVRATMGLNLYQEPFPYPDMATKMKLFTEFTGEDGPSFIDQLPVPDLLKRYLKLEDVVNKFGKFLLNKSFNLQRSIYHDLFPIN